MKPMKPTTTDPPPCTYCSSTDHTGAAHLYAFDDPFAFVAPRPRPERTRRKRLAAAIGSTPPEATPEDKVILLGLRQRARPPEATPEEARLSAQLARARKRSKANARKAEVRRVAIVAAMERLDEIAGRLRETATGLRQWQRTGCTEPGRCGSDPPCVHPSHAANRLERMADEINAGRTNKQETTNV